MTPSPFQPAHKLKRTGVVTDKPHINSLKVIQLVFSNLSCGHYLGERMLVDGSEASFLLFKGQWALTPARLGAM
jgi:hypothetical protein